MSVSSLVNPLNVFLCSKEPTEGWLDAETTSSRAVSLYDPTEADATAGAGSSLAVSTKSPSVSTSPWVRKTDSRSGRVYFVHMLSKKTQWKVIKQKMLH